ncbi:hypothetical protein, partial [Craterilacuibacter sp.]|uniref:hypothetical protein n=1 Tax=Craterilacuibacter sp. TaxID=2870909 RepID=UPI003F39437E
MQAKAGRQHRPLWCLFFLMLAGCAERQMPLGTPAGLPANIDSPAGAELSWLSLGDARVALQTRYGPCRRGGV